MENKSSNYVVETSRIAGFLRYIEKMFVFRNGLIEE